MSTPGPSPEGLLNEPVVQKLGSELRPGETMTGTLDSQFNPDLESSGETINVLIGTGGINVTDLQEN